MDFFATPKVFTGSKISDGLSLYDMTNIICEELSASKMDRHVIRHVMEDVDFTEDYVLIFQARGRTVYAGTFRPGKIPMDEELREELTKTYYFAPEYFGCYLIRKFRGDFIIEPYNLKQLAELHTSVVYSVLNIDDVECQWLNGRKPEADFEFSDHDTIEFKLTPEDRDAEVPTNFHYWRLSSSGGYTARILIKKNLYDIMVEPRDDGTIYVIINLLDCRPRSFGNVPQETLAGFLKAEDSFTLSCTPDGRGDMDFNTQWRKLKGE